jgi:hypothetical protein
MSFIEHFRLWVVFPAFFLIVSTAFSQEAIKFQIPLDDSGEPVQKLGSAAGMPLNLAALSAKDTASFETYSIRFALLQDSIAATRRQIDAVRKNTESFMQPLEPKGEFEKQADYDAKRQKWNTELSQRIERDTRSLTSRLAELEKAKNKVQENQASLYGSVEIKSNPSNVSIWLGNEEIGASPAEYKLLVPGTARISLRKESYNQWDTTLQVTPGAKFKLNIVMEEKSIFSQQNEIDFVRFLNKDTTVQGFEARIEVVFARKAEVDEEIKTILADFSNAYPALEPQRAGESPESYKNRHDAWTREGMRQVAELQRKHKIYVEKLGRTVEVLNDYIIATHSSILSEPAIGAKIELGSYDAEKESFEFAAQDTENRKSPFLFKGKVIVPIAVAPSINRQSPGFVAGVQFINYPFDTGSDIVNLGMSKLLLSNNGKELKVDGSFDEIDEYKSMPGYGAWKLRADSLLSGRLKAQGLDYSYAMGKPVKFKEEKSSDDDGFGWRIWARIAAFTATVAFGGGAVYKHLEADSKLSKIRDLEKNLPLPSEEAAWINNYDANKNLVKDNEKHRNIFGAVAGICALAGTLTFFF